MPVYTVQGPSGKKYTIEGPDNASADDLGKVILDSSQEERKALQLQSDRETYAPTAGQSFLENAQQGVGKAFADLGRGASSLVRSFGPQYAASADAFGLPNANDIQESRRLDAPLMSTGGGKVGSFVGNAAMAGAAAPAFGATLAGGAAAGAASGLTQPATDLREQAINAGLGTLGGLGGQWVGNKIGSALQARKDAIAAAAPQVAQKAAAAKEAAQAGYVIPPEDLGGGAVTKALSGLSGKIKTAQQASAKNQTVTNQLVRQELGLAGDAPLTVDALNAVRKAAVQDYAAVSGSGTVVPGSSYESALDAAIAPFKSAQRSFPNAKPNPVIQEIEALKTPQFDAGDAVAQISILRDQADEAYRAGQNMAGKAYKSAATALEDALDAHLSKAGPSDALNRFRESRKLIAKTYSVQKALNSETGDVSAHVLANELKKGKPLSGGIKTVAQTGLAFPKATQALKESPKALSPLDFATAGLGLVGSGGSPLAAAGLAARPLGRSVLLSAPYQARAVGGAGNVQQPSFLLRGAQPMALPAGLLAPYVLEQ